MRFDETTAFTCRYGDNAAVLFEGADVIWEDSTADYQGSASIFAQMPDGTFLAYEWSYGSCSGCDGWEAEGLDGDQIVAAMRREAVTFDSIESAKAYLAGYRRSMWLSEEGAALASFEAWLKSRN